MARADRVGRTAGSQLSYDVHKPGRVDRLPTWQVVNGVEFDQGHPQRASEPTPASRLPGERYPIQEPRPTVAVPWASTTGASTTATPSSFDWPPSSRRGHP